MTLPSGNTLPWAGPSTFMAFALGVWLQVVPYVYDICPWELAAGGTLQS